MITRSSFIALFTTSIPVFADTLLVGSIYFDSEQTLNEVITLSAQHDNEGIAKLIQNGHISDLTREEKDIVVLIRGSTPESPTEFSFFNGSTPFWTLTKNVTNFAKPTPMPLPTLTLEATPLPTESPTPSSKQHNRQNETNAPFTGNAGKRISHRVDGKRKWSPANNRQVTGRPAAATRPIPTATPRVSPSPAAARLTASPRPTPTLNEGTPLYNSDFTQPFKNYRKPEGQ